MKSQNQQVFELHAEVCKMLANPKRLQIIDLLAKGEKSVGEMAEALEIPLATVSQHLRLLRDKHLVLSRKDGQTVHYRLRDSRMIEACHIIRSVLLDGMKMRGDVATDLAPQPGVAG